MKYDLVFEGGGAKGMVFVGAMQEFEARSHTYDRLLGTSAGAITATLLAAEYTAEEMLAALDEREGNRPVFAGFMATPPGFSEADVKQSVTYNFLQRVNVPLVPAFVENKVDDWLIGALMNQPSYRNMFSFVEHGGWFSAHKFIAWLAGKLDSGSFRGQPRQFSQMTLAEFFAATGYELSVVAADTTNAQLLVLNHTTAPDCPVVWAVRMSMSIPLVWPEVKWLAEWGRYRDQDISGHLIVDGGLLSNFPLELFISEQPYVTKLLGAKRSENVLGLLIDESKPVPEPPAGDIEASLDYKKLRTVQRITRLINTITQAHDKMVIKAFEHLVVRLPAQAYGIIEFDMSDARKTALVAAGQATMAQYFDGAVQMAAQPGLSPPAIGQADRLATRLLALPLTESGGQN